MNFRTLKIIVVSFLLVAGIASCEKDDTTPKNLTGGPLVAKVDGVQFTSDNSKAKAKYVASTKMLQVIGQTSDQKETIVFQILPFSEMKVSSASDFKPGTYDFDPLQIANLKYSAIATFTNYIGSEYINWSTKWEYVQNGKIIIESNSGSHIKGTFHFDAVKQNNNGTFDASNIKKISEGAFDLDIINY